MNIRLIVPNKWSQANMAAVYPVKRYGPDIADIAGGFTATQATGGWKDSTGMLVVEPVTVFDCSCEHDIVSLERGLVDCATLRFRDLAKRIAKELRQDCVYLAIDGRVEFVKP